MISVPAYSLYRREKIKIPLTSSQISNSRKLTAVDLSGMLLMSVAMLQIMRNLTAIYLGVWIVSVLVFVVFWTRSRKITVGLNIFCLCIVGLYLYCGILSLLISDRFGSPVLGLLRLGFIIPTIFVAIYAVDRQSFRSFCILWLVFALLAALSLPIQYITGPISWFSESFERAGIARFGSLAGSLTTFGNIVGTAMFIVLIGLRRPRYIMIAGTVLIIGAAASLQKAAFASIGIAALTALLSRQIKVGAFLGVSAAITFVGLIGLYAADYQTRGTIILLFETFIGTVDIQQASDVSISQSVFDRIFDLPVVAFDFYGTQLVWSGIGVFGGSGSLGYPELPHTHNLIGETILLFGFIPGSFIILYLAGIFWRSILIIVNIGGRYDQNAVMAAGILVNIVLPTIFAGGLFYHPAGATVFWTALVYLQFHARPVDG